MDECKSTARFLELKKLLILVQTDTTVGFVSQDEQRLLSAKSRESSKHFIKALQSFKTLNIRVPKKHRRFVRNASRTTFIVKDNSFRIAPSPRESKLLRDLPWLYTTSANKSKNRFDMDFCFDKADIIIEDVFGLSERSSSKIFRLTKDKIRRVR